MSAVPTALGVFLQSLDSCLANPGFSEQRGQCEQQDSWRQEQNMTLTVPTKENDVFSLCSHTFSMFYSFMVKYCNIFIAIANDISFAFIL